MNREQIKKWRDDPYGATGKYGMTRADFKQLCDLALRGLEAGEPRLVSYAPDMQTCTLAAGDNQFLFDRHIEAGEPEVKP